MKIWCTFNSAGSLIGRGLQNIEVWFAKPTWVVESHYMYYDSPFGDLHEDPTQGIITCQGWQREYISGEKFERQYLSFGRAFGYGDNEDPEISTLALYVWDKLCEFYGTDNLLKWADIESEGKTKIPQTHQPYQFILEIDLSITLKS